MFTIGEFSRLSHISARMLRHYDSIGLLKPVMTGGGNGYRYYDNSQLVQVNEISRLKEYGFELHEISELLKLPQEQLEKRVQLQYQQLRQQKMQLDLVIHHMETYLKKKENHSMNQYHVIRMNQKEQRVLTVGKKIKVTEQNIHMLVQELYLKLKKQSLQQTGPIQISYLDEEFDPENTTVEVQIEVAGEGEDIKILPAGEYVTVMHIGPMSEIQNAYEAITKWLSENDEDEICGPCIERMIRDEHMAENETQLETAVMFPIRHKE